MLVRVPDVAYVSMKEVKQSVNQLAAVGEATSAALEDLGFDDVFVPSKASGETVASKLLVVEGYENEDLQIQVLYPYSAKASDTIPTHLEARRASKPSKGLPPNRCSS